MLVFIDESGDSGVKFEQGSSRFFVVVMVVFEDTAEAASCDQAIGQLKQHLGWSQADEFHFRRNSHQIRRQFLQVVAHFGFFYYGVLIDKRHPRFRDYFLANKHDFYKYAAGLVFENAKDKLRDTTIVIDRSDNLHLMRRLAKYLRQQINQPSPLIKTVKMQRSQSNNLIQLADYVANIINRVAQKNKKHANDYRALLSHREISVLSWPK